ncbi:MAG: hypothetical protein KAJ73_00430 [Zetaproteobacteria bacterium]|nr:hypothetical protein [Zetaproteobacteria bacterium]
MLGILMGNWKLIVGALVIMSLLAAIIGFKSHYDTLKAERDDFLVASEHEKDAHRLTTASFKDYRHTTETQILGMQTALATLSERFAAAQEKANELEKVLGKHNLGSLAQTKPGLVERVINDGTNRVFRELEDVTKRPADDSGGEDLPD